MTRLEFRLTVFVYTSVLVAGTALITPWFGIGAIITAGAGVATDLWRLARRKEPG